MITSEPDGMFWLKFYYIKSTMAFGFVADGPINRSHDRWLYKKGEV